MNESDDRASMMIVKYKCTKCGLETAIAKEKTHNLPKAECQNCLKMTLKPMLKKAYHIKIPSGQKFVCDSLNDVARFIENFSKDYPQTAIYIMIAEMSEDEYKTIPPSEESIKYFG